MKHIVIALSLLFFGHSAAFAAAVLGRVRDAETAEPLPFANIYLEEAKRGTSTDLDGKFEIANISEGSDILVIRFVGYKTHRIPIVVTDRAYEVVVALVPEAFRGKEVIIVAERAKLRETPVAFSDVPKADMDRKLGSLYGII